MGFRKAFQTSQSSLFCCHSIMLKNTDKFFVFLRFAGSASLPPSSLDLLFSWSLLTEAILMTLSISCSSMREELVLDALFLEPTGASLLQLDLPTMGSMHSPPPGEGKSSSSFTHYSVVCFDIPLAEHCQTPAAPLCLLPAQVSVDYRSCGCRWSLSGHL